MSQRDFMQAFDAAAFDAFFGAGLADEAMYTAPGAEPLPVSVLVDRGRRDFGDDAAPVSTQYVRITFQRSQVQPRKQARVEILPDGEAFRLVHETEDSDESASRWVVERA